MGKPSSDASEPREPAKDGWEGFGDAELIDLAPSARSLIEGMRDLGYSLESALADIVDNSIAAGAGRIQIFAEANGGNPRVGVLDDGRAMTGAELLEAMRPSGRGPNEERAESDLGRFGLGLKTASFSQGRRLTVVTCRQGQVLGAAWDLDRVADLDRWAVEKVARPESVPWADELDCDGTLVVWEKLDRLIEKTSASENAAHFARRVGEARAHLELVFHRYLSGEPGLPKVSMSLNNKQLMPFDPFHSGHSATIKDPVEQIHCGAHLVTVQVFTLPHFSKVSQSDWDKYAGVGGYTKNQGFYLYRQKRLIIWGTWFGLARHTELTKLTRVRIDTPTALDHDWHIDVKKSSAQPPHVVREHLRNKIEVIGATSRRVYTKRGTKLTTQNRLPVWQRIQDDSAISYGLDRTHPMLAGFAAGLGEPERTEFTRILTLIEAAFPLDAVLADLATSAEKLQGVEVTDQELRDFVVATYHQLQEKGTPGGEIEAMMGSAEPFRSNWPATAEILRTLERETRAAE